MPEVIQIKMQDPLYQEERRLRNRVLLKPLGIPDFGWELKDPISLHFVALHKGGLIGCVLLAPLAPDNTVGQLMQMAVEPAWQNQGVGKLLVEHLLKSATTAGFNEIQIHSRSVVTSFYEQFGFKVFGEEFEEVGVQHRYMSKKI